MATATSATATKQHVNELPSEVPSKPDARVSRMQHTIGDTYMQLEKYTLALRSYTDAAAWSFPDNPDLITILDRLHRVKSKLNPPANTRPEFLSTSTKA